MATEAFTQSHFSHEDCRQCTGRMTRVCQPDLNATLSRAPKEMFVTRHVGHDTAAVSPLTRDDGETGMLTDRDGERSGVSTVLCVPSLRAESFQAAAEQPVCRRLLGNPGRVSVDITGPHPRSTRQNRYILTCVDHFSKWAEAIALRNHTAPSVMRALMRHVFSRFGAPRQLLSDQGREIESDLFAALMKWMKIDKLRTTAYQPSSTGAV